MCCFPLKIFYLSSMLRQFIKKKITISSQLKLCKPNLLLYDMEIDSNKKRAGIINAPQKKVELWQKEEQKEGM